MRNRHRLVDEIPERGTLYYSANLLNRMVGVLKTELRRSHFRDVGKFILVALVTTSLFSLMTSLPSAAISPSHERNASSSVVQPHTVACTPAEYNVDVQLPLAQRHDCGASMTVPATINAGACPYGPDQAACLANEEFSVTLSVPGYERCTNPGTPIVACLPDPSIQVFALDANGKPLYGTSLSPGNWCGANEVNCGLAGAPQRVGLYLGGTWPKQFTLYVYVFITGVFYTIAKTTVNSGAPKKTPKVNPLSVSISLTDSQGNAVSPLKALIGMKLDANVTISVSSSASGSVGNIAASPPVAVSPTQLLSPQGGPSPPIPAGGFTLAPGSSTKYSVPFTLASVGDVTLSVKVKGTTSSGQTVRASDSTTANLSASALVMTVVTKPAKVNLAVNDKGEVIPQKVTVTVTFKNTSSRTLNNAQLLLLAPEPVIKSQQLDKLALNPGTLPLPIGTLAPGSHSHRDFSLTVTGDGKYQWRSSRAL